MSVSDEVFGYEFNMFAFPDGYFEQKTAEELRISEEARQILIQEQRENKIYRETNKDRVDPEIVRSEVFNNMLKWNSFPEDYYEMHTAEELGISEKARKILIEERRKHEEMKNRPFTEKEREYIHRKLKEFDENDKRRSR